MLYDNADNDCNPFSMELLDINKTNQFSEVSMLRTRRSKEYSSWIEKASLLPPLSEAIRDMGFWVYASSLPKRKNVSQNTQTIIMTADEHHNIDITIFRELCFQYEHLRNSIILYNYMLLHYNNNDMKGEKKARENLIEKICSLTEFAYELLNSMVQKFYMLLEDTHTDDVNLIKRVFLEQDIVINDTPTKISKCSFHHNLDRNETSTTYKNSNLNDLKDLCKEELEHYEEHFQRVVDCEQILLLNLKPV